MLSAAPVKPITAETETLRVGDFLVPNGPDWPTLEDNEKEEHQVMYKHECNHTTYAPPEPSDEVWE